MGRPEFWALREGRKGWRRGRGRRVDVRRESEGEKTQMARRVGNEAGEHC